MRVFGLDGVLAARLAESIALDPDLSTMDGERMRAWSTSAHVRAIKLQQGIFRFILIAANARQ